MITSQKDFELWKKQALTKKDKSTAQGIDKPIQELCDKINYQENYFTLSSCSGRISLQKEIHKKITSIWKFVTHNKTSQEEIVVNLTNIQEDIWFVQESAILHICCRSLNDARSLIQKAKECGWNQCGIIACKTKIVVEIIVDSFIKTPITKESKIIISKDFLEVLVEQANNNLEKSWFAIEKLEEAF